MTAAVPSGWSLERIDAVADVNPRRPSELRELIDDHLVTFVPMSAVDENTGSIALSTRTFCEVKKGFTYFAEGDVIVAKITPCMQNGKAAIATGLSNGLGFGSTEFHVLRPKPATCSEWLWYFVRNPEFRQEATHHFQGAVGQQRVPAEFLAGHQIPIPPLDEQHRIVARIRELLDRVDEGRRLRSDSSREIEHVEGSVFADFVQGNAEESHVPVEPLGAVLLDTDYGTSAKANTAGRGARILRMGNIQDGHLDVEDVKHIELSNSELVKYTLHHGDILINRTNSLEQVGKAAVFDLTDGPWVFASYLIRLLLDQRKARPEYVSAVINSRIGRGYVRRTARRAIGMVNINVKEIEAMPMPLPSIQVQEAVVARIAEARKAIQQIRANLPVFNERQLQSAILRKAFAGEL